MYIYSRNPHDFELGSYEKYRHRVTDDTLVENIYKAWLSLFLHPVETISLQEILFLV